jgi:hypothetical protein
MLHFTSASNIHRCCCCTSISLCIQDTHVQYEAAVEAHLLVVVVTRVVVTRVVMR